MRKNAFQAAIEVNDVSKAYAGEFYRMFSKNFIDKDTLTVEYNKINMEFDISKYQPALEIARFHGTIPSHKTAIR